MSYTLNERVVVGSMTEYELNKDMHNSCVQTMKELVQYGLASQEYLETVLRLQEQFEKESQDENH